MPFSVGGDWQIKRDHFAKPLRERRRARQCKRLDFNGRNAVKRNKMQGSFNE